MIKQLFLIAILLSSCVHVEKNVNTSAEKNTDRVEIDSTSAQERAFFKQFANIEIADRVRRHYRMEDKEEVNFLNEFVYENAEGLMNGAYIDIEMTFSKIDTLQKQKIWANYNYYVGQASDVSGSILYQNGKRVQTETGCGVTHCVTTVMVNGVETVVEEVSR